MESLNRILQEISALTLKIEEQYPELYRYLDENPVTLPHTGDTDSLTTKNFADYLESLKSILEHHLETHLDSKDV